MINTNTIGRSSAPQSVPKSSFCDTQTQTRPHLCRRDRKKQQQLDAVKDNELCTLQVAVEGNPLPLAFTYLKHPQPPPLSTIPPTKVHHIGGGRLSWKYQTTTSAFVRSDKFKLMIQNGKTRFVDNSKTCNKQIPVYLPSKKRFGFPRGPSLPSNPLPKQSFKVHDVSSDTSAKVSDDKDDFIFDDVWYTEEDTKNDYVPSSFIIPLSFAYMDLPTLKPALKRYLYDQFLSEVENHVLYELHLASIILQRDPQITLTSNTTINHKKVCLYAIADTVPEVIYKVQQTSLLNPEALSFLPTHKSQTSIISDSIVEEVASLTLSPIPEEEVLILHPEVNDFLDPIISTSLFINDPVLHNIPPIPEEEVLIIHPENDDLMQPLLPYSPITYVAQALDDPCDFGIHNLINEEPPFFADDPPPNNNPPPEPSFFASTRQIPRNFNKLLDKSNIIVDKVTASLHAIEESFASIKQSFSAATGSFLDCSLLFADFVNLVYDVVNYQLYSLPIAIIKIFTSVTHIVHFFLPGFASTPNVQTQSFSSSLTDLFTKFSLPIHFLTIGKYAQALANLERGITTLKHFSEWCLSHLPNFLRDLILHYFPAEDEFTRRFKTFAEALILAGDDLDKHIPTPTVKLQFFEEEKHYFDAILSVKSRSNSDAYVTYIRLLVILCRVREFSVNFQLYSTPRHTPFTIILSGDSRSGKSTLMNHISILLHSIFKHQGPTAYVRNVGCDFWDGCPPEVYSILYDDFLQDVELSDVPEFFSLVTRSHFIIPQAALDNPLVGNKGTLCTAPLVIASTNCIDLSHAVSNRIKSPEAFEARITLHIIVHKKGEYDPTGQFHHQFYDVVRTTYGNPQAVPIRKGLNFKQLIHFILFCYKKHFQREAEITQATHIPDTEISDYQSFYEAQGLFKPLLLTGISYAGYCFCLDKVVKALSGLMINYHHMPYTNIALVTGFTFLCAGFAYIMHASVKHNVNTVVHNVCDTTKRAIAILECFVETPSNSSIAHQAYAQLKLAEHGKSPYIIRDSVNKLIEAAKYDNQDAVAASTFLSTYIVNNNAFTNKLQAYTTESLVEKQRSRASKLNVESLVEKQRTNVSKLNVESLVEKQKMTPSNRIVEDYSESPYLNKANFKLQQYNDELYQKFEAIPPDPTSLNNFRADYTTQGFTDPKTVQVIESLPSIYCALTCSDTTTFYIADVKALNYVNAVHVRDNFFLLPRHFFLDKNGELLKNSPNKNYFLTFTFGKHHVVAYDPARLHCLHNVNRTELIDAVLYDLRGTTMPTPRDNLTKFIKSNSVASIKNGDNCTMVCNTIQQGKPQLIHRTFPITLLNRAVGYQLSETRTLYTTSGVTYFSPTVSGDCGSPLLIHNPALNEKIIGIHTYGDVKADSGAIFIVQEMFAPFFTSQTPPIEIDPTFSISSESSVNYKTQNLSIERCEDLSTPIYINRTTSYTPSCFQPLFYDFTKHPSVKTGELDPALLSTMMFGSDLISYTIPCPTQINDYFATTFVNQPASVLNALDAINVHGGMDVLNLHTSAGYPHIQLCRDKNYYIRNVDGVLSYKDPTYHSFLDDYITSWKTTCHPIHWIVSLKDNLDKPGKLCRIFEIPPLEYSIATRAYYGSWISMMHLNCMKAYSCIGINADSKEWSTLMYSLLSVSDQGFDADVPSWDKNLSAYILFYVNNIVNAWYKKNDPDWHISHDTARYNLLYAMIHGYLLCGATVWRKHIGMCSGWVLTALFNTMCNMLQHLIWYYLSVPLTYRDLSYYNKYVVTKIYGDDSIDSVSPCVIQYLNRSSMLLIYTNYFNMTISSSRKDGTLLLAEPIIGLTFLKRGFRKSSIYYLPLLDYRSIVSMISYVRSSRFSTLEQQLQVNLHVALQFLYFYGPTIFNNFHSLLLSMFPNKMYPRYSYYDDLFLTGSLPIYHFTQ